MEDFSKLKPSQKKEIICSVVTAMNCRIDNFTYFENERLCVLETLNAVVIYPNEGERMYDIDLILKVAIVLNMSINFGIKEDNGKMHACLTLSPYIED